VLRHFALGQSWLLNQTQTRRLPEHRLELEHEQDGGEKVTSWAER
jgi:hypothetical protein